MKKLSINTPLKDSSSSKPKIADSWDDGESGSDQDDLPQLQPDSSLHVSRPSESYPSAPPPTPMSPGFANLSSQMGSEQQRADPDPHSDRRPEKTTQAASRMIAAGLGVKAPKRSEEQREYDRAMREKEIKLRNQQKEERRKQEEEREKAKAAMWDD